MTNELRNNAKHQVVLLACHFTGAWFTFMLSESKLSIMAHPLQVQRYLGESPGDNEITTLTNEKTRLLRPYL